MEIALAKPLAASMHQTIRLGSSLGYVKLNMLIYYNTIVYCSIFLYYTILYINIH